MTDRILQTTDWAPNVILVDIDWIDKLVFDVPVNFERVLERRIPKMGLPDWADSVSLDGGLRPGDNEVQVLLVYTKGHEWLHNCLPADLLGGLDGKAFKDRIGEFRFAVIPVEGEVIDKGELMKQSLEALMSEERIKRLMVVGDLDSYGNQLREAMDGGDKQTTLYVLEPQTGFHCAQEMLPYSVLAALGIRSEELK